MRDQSTTGPIRCETGLADGLRSEDSGSREPRSIGYLQVG